VLRASERRRKKVYAETVHRLGSADFQRMLLRFGAWLHSGHWPESDIPLKRFARHILEKQHGRVIAQGAALKENPAQLHALRIACKKMRYSAEMFGSLFANGRGKTYVAQLAAVQDALGALNDLAAAERLLLELESRQRRDTLALIRGWIALEYAGRIARFSVVWQRFAKKNGFWNGCHSARPGAMQVKG